MKEMSCEYNYSSRLSELIPGLKVEMYVLNVDTVCAHHLSYFLLLVQVLSCFPIT